MNLTEAYTYLFFDSAMASLIFPIHSALVYPSMLMFGGYNITIIAFLALCGALLGAIANFWLGKALVSVSKYSPEDGKALMFFSIVKKYAPYILLLSWVPILGSVLVVTSGAVGVRFIRSMGVFVIVNSAYYCALAVISA